MVHNMLYISMLKKYIIDPSHAMSQEPIEKHEDVTYDEKPNKILCKEEKVLRNNVIPLVDDQEN